MPPLSLPAIRQRMGLIIGPAFTCGPNWIDAFRKALGAQEGEILSSLAKAAIPNVAEARGKLAAVVGTLPPVAELKALAEGRWQSILSFSLDLRLEEAVAKHLSKTSATGQIDKVWPLSRTPITSSIPAFKLLGPAFADDFVITTAELLRAKQFWKTACSDAVDATRDAPFVCLGLTGLEQHFFELVSCFNPARLPRFLFLASDPLRTSDTLKELLGDKLLIFEGTVGELIRMAKPTPKTAVATTAQFRTIENFSESIVCVNNHAHEKTQKSEHNRLLQLHFSPDPREWDSYRHNIDFARTAGMSINEEVQQLISNPGPINRGISITGPSATGKSVILRRIAFNAQANGHLVLWAKQTLTPHTKAFIEELVSSISSLKLKQPLLLCVDDPVSLGTFRIASLTTALERANQRYVVAVTARTFDWKGRHDAHYFEGLPATEEFELPDELDTPETNALAEYLVKIQIAETHEASKKLIHDAESRSARDVLGMLWTLIPLARESIGNSVRDELFRIGDAKTLKKFVLGKQQHSPEIVQNAYKLAVVASEFRTPLPVEVLAATLNVDYETWLNSESTATYVTGLLDIQQDDDGSIYYAPRTDVVTEIIVETINGGKSQHGVSLELARKLLTSCTGSSIIYREFGLSILRAMWNQEWITYEQGNQLFDSLEGALPQKDKTLVHQRANWVRKKGSNPTVAKTLLMDALGTPDYPNATKHEADEHIFTSIAACALDEVESGRVGFEAGKQEVISALAKARSASFFNTNAVHVNARLTKRLIAKMPPGLDRISLANEALAEVDRALLLVGPGDETRATRDREMLAHVRSEVLSESDPSASLEDEAFKAWEANRTQDLFVLVCRRMLERAQHTKAGSDFNRSFEYWKRVNTFLSDKGAKRSPSLSEVCLHIYYDWLIHSRRNDREKIDWAFALELCEDTRTAAKSKQDPFYLYMHGLCLAQFGRWPDANTVFANVRRSSLPRGVRTAVRDYLLSDTGGMRVLQGPVRSTGGQSTVTSAELKTDFVLDRRTPVSTGSYIHFVVGFSFMGPSAIPK